MCILNTGSTVKFQATPYLSKPCDTLAVRHSTGPLCSDTVQRAVGALPRARRCLVLRLLTCNTRCGTRRVLERPRNARDARPRGHTRSACVPGMTHTNA
jgi:hypothetical protein